MNYHHPSHHALPSYLSLVCHKCPSPLSCHTCTSYARHPSTPALTCARLRVCTPTKFRSAKLPCQGFCVPTDFRIAHESNQTRTNAYKKKRDRAPVQIRTGRAASNGPFRPNRERGATSEGGLWSGTPRHTHMPSSSKMTL